MGDDINRFVEVPSEAQFAFRARATLGARIPIADDIVRPKGDLPRIEPDDATDDLLEPIDVRKLQGTQVSPW